MHPGPRNPANSGDEAKDSSLADRLVSLCLLHGRFTLRSGTVANQYFDKYLFEARPDLLREVAEAAALLVPPDTQVLAGLELGGIPVATALSLHTGLPAAFVRKTRKEYGTERLAEGADVTGRHVLVIEDVITTGGQVVESVAALRNEGAVVDHVLCIIDRSNGRATGISDAGLSLRAVISLAAA
ncbi:MAG: orotate phosphoribosyltransferase [Candidatus Dormibacteraeota bacterium]|uniref:Orotate phosphoribosyltransferase n=1 Tax=Candidatus Aeolococcus gillhamiae TaxID=3127015 RepID=A0A934N4P7_9BACT|nr:orotate phosphoribosyltransferase [Candidatus Dormibacteraeota bacterium]